MSVKASIDIKGIQFYANHGVLEQERKVGNLFEVSVCLKYDADKAMSTDYVDKALNYADVIGIINDVMLKPSNLLENVAARLYEALMAKYPYILGGQIEVAKIQPPVSTPIDKVAFVIEW